MKVKKTEILRRIWLFSANKIKSSESVGKQPTQLIVQLNSSLRQKLGTLVLQQTFKLSPGFKSVHAKFVTSTLEPIICSPETSLQFIWSNFAATIVSRLLKKWSFCIQKPLYRNIKFKIVRKITSYLTSKLSKSPPICSGLPGAPGVPNGFSGMKASTHSKGSETPSALTAMTWNMNKKYFLTFPAFF